MNIGRIQAKLFGDFALSLNGESLIQWRSRGSKMIALLQYLVYNYGKTFTKEHLWTILYGEEEESEDISNAFRVTLHRLRKMLISSGMPEDVSFIINKNGMCGWNKDLPVETDVNSFLEYIEKAKNEPNPERSLEHRMNALDFYTNELLPDYIMEDWVAVESTKLKNIYIECINRITEALIKKDDHYTLYSIATRAGAIYPYDENFQISRIKSLLALRRPKEALEVYEGVTEIYFTELGIKPSENMTSLRSVISKHIPAEDLSIDALKRSLDEPEMAPGAFYCDYLTFVKSYQFAHRMLERTGQSAYIMLCSLVDLAGKPVTDEAKLSSVADVISSSIQRALRRGDMFTCVSPGKYLLLLIGINQENCSIVTGRIDIFFREDFHGRGLRIKFKFLPASTLNLNNDFNTNLNSPKW